MIIPIIYLFIYLAIQILNSETQKLLQLNNVAHITFMSCNLLYKTLNFIEKK